MSYKYEAKDSNELVKEGDYEAIIERMEVKTLPSGKNKLSLMYRIRNDIEQPYSNKVMFEDIWEEKETPGIFNRKRINRLLGTQEVEDGTEFASINDIISLLVGSALIIHIAIELNEYKGEDVNTVSYYKKTKVVAQKVGAVAQEPEKAPTPTRVYPGNNNIVDDSDVPF